MKSVESLLKHLAIQYCSITSWIVMDWSQDYALLLVKKEYMKCVLMLRNI